MKTDIQTLTMMRDLIINLYGKKAFSNDNEEIIAQMVQCLSRRHHSLDETYIRNIINKCKTLEKETL